MPGGSPLLRRIGDGVDVVTYLGEYTRRPDRAGAVARGRGPDGPAGAGRRRRAVPRRTSTARGARPRYGLRDRPVVVCVSRLMPRKGQDTLVQALPAIRSRVPGAALLLVGGGPYRERVERLVDRTGVEPADVVFTGPVPAEELPAHYAAGDVFAMPCRTRNRGPGRRGAGHRLPGGVGDRAAGGGRATPAGRPTPCCDGETGFVVPGRDVAEVADRVSELLLDPARARAMGARGRAWVEQAWRWDQVAATARRTRSTAGAPVGRRRDRRQRCQVAAEGEGDQHDHGDDRGHQQAVLDRRAPAGDRASQTQLVEHRPSSAGGVGPPQCGSVPSALLDRGTDSDRPRGYTRSAERRIMGSAPPERSGAQTVGWGPSCLIRPSRSADMIAWARLAAPSFSYSLEMWVLAVDSLM